LEDEEEKEEEEKKFCVVSSLHPTKDPYLFFFFKEIAFCCLRWMSVEIHARFFSSGHIVPLSNFNIIIIIIIIIVIIIDVIIILCT